MNTGEIIIVEESKDEIFDKEKESESFYLWELTIVKGKISRDSIVIHKGDYSIIRD